MRIAFFGGTFDPPHCGHVDLARQVLAGDWTDRIMFVPAFHPPHKQGDVVTPFEHRLNMLKLTVPPKDEFLISDIEADAALKPSYTSEVLRLLEHHYPEDRLQLLIGEDSLWQLHTWHDAHRLVSHRELLVYPRHPIRVTRSELLRHWSVEETDVLLNSRLQMPFFDISSSEIRKKVANGKNLDEMVNVDVVKYIGRHDLYRNRKTSGKIFA